MNAFRISCVRDQSYAFQMNLELTISENRELTSIPCVLNKFGTSHTYGDQAQISTRLITNPHCYEYIPTVMSALPITTPHWSGSAYSSSAVGRRISTVNTAALLACNGCRATGLHFDSCKNNTVTLNRLAASFD
jgi:hypothetical protein